MIASLCLLSFVLIFSRKRYLSLLIFGFLGGFSINIQILSFNSVSISNEVKHICHASTINRESLSLRHTRVLCKCLINSINIKSEITIISHIELIPFIFFVLEKKFLNTKLFNCKIVKRNNLAFIHHFRKPELKLFDIILNMIVRLS